MQSRETRSSILRLLSIPVNLVAIRTLRAPAWPAVIIVEKRGECKDEVVTMEGLTTLL